MMHRPLQQQEVTTRRSTFSLIFAAAVVMAASTSEAGPRQQERPVDRAFEHYESIRAAFAQDTTKGVATDATALSRLARDIAGEDAGRAAEALAKAKGLDETRVRFGVLSEALVPTFIEADLPGVHGFVCSMKQKPWAQRGSTPANPYYGKAMPSCGTPIKDPGQKR